MREPSLEEYQEIAGGIEFQLNRAVQIGLFVCLFLICLGIFTLGLGIGFLLDWART